MAAAETPALCKNSKLVKVKGSSFFCSLHQAHWVAIRLESSGCKPVEGGSAGGGETAGVDGLTKLSLELEGCCLLDVTSNGARACMLGFLETMTIFDGPSKGADGLCSLGAARQQGFYIGACDTLLIEPLSKMLGSRVSSSVVIAVADTTSLLCVKSSVKSSVKSVQSSDSGGRQAVQFRRLEHCCMTDSKLGARLTGQEPRHNPPHCSPFPGCGSWLSFLVSEPGVSFE
jgi:hypothetical protein